MSHSFLSSKVQARFAFAMYLTRVQQRLVAETTSEETEDADIANEQMVLLWSPQTLDLNSLNLKLGDRDRKYWRGGGVVEILTVVTLIKLSSVYT